MNGQSCDGYLIGGAVNFFAADVDVTMRWYERCTGTTVCKVASGCVHEHVIVWDSCPDCARKVAAQIEDGKAACPVIVQVQAPTA